MREFWPRNKLQIWKKKAGISSIVWEQKKLTKSICFPNKQQHFNVTDGKHKDIIESATLDMIFLISSDYIKKTVRPETNKRRSIKGATNSQYISKS